MAMPTETYECISISDLQFDRIPITMFSSTGYKYTRWVEIGMPKIPEKIKDCIFFLYKSEKDAIQGKKSGGSGFLIGVQSDKYPEYSQYNYICGVSNCHVVKNRKYSVIRLNKLDGSIEIIPFSPDDWISFPKDHLVDIVISPQINISQGVHKASFIHTSLFATEEILNICEIGIGDNIFMIGRFMDYDGGRNINEPSTRFGNVSVMPIKIKQETGYKNGQSYIMDIHSRTGYSGSPVFVYRTIVDNIDEWYKVGKKNHTYHKNQFLYLIGIHWGQFPEEWETNTGPFRGITKGMSGMTLVIPAQLILDLLNSPPIKDHRDKWEMNLQEHFKRNGYPPVAESATYPSNQENPQHKEDFNSLLTAAVKKKPQADET